MYWQYAIIVAVLILISFIVIKLKKKDFAIEINKLIQYLGGKDNILDTQINLSRLKVTLKDIDGIITTPQIKGRFQEILSIQKIKDTKTQKTYDGLVDTEFLQLVNNLLSNYENTLK